MVSTLLEILVKGEPFDDIISFRMSVSTLLEILGLVCLVLVCF